jgi:hypothetical protein
LLRRIFGIQFDCAIQEPGLSREFDRLGFVQGGDLQDFSESAKPIDGGVQVGGAVAKVRAERKINSVVQE